MAPAFCYRKILRFQGKNIEILLYFVGHIFLFPCIKVALRTKLL